MFADLSPLQSFALALMGIALMLAILLGLLWQRTREAGLNFIGLAYFITFLCDAGLAMLGAPSATAYAPAFWIIAGLSVLSLMVGVMIFLRGHTQRGLLDLLECAGIGGSIYLVFGVLFENPMAGYAALAIVQLRCAALAWKASQREPEAGYRWIFAALLCEPLLTALALLQPLQFADLFLADSFFWLLIGFAVLGVTIYRSRLQVRRESDGRITAERLVQENIYLDSLTGLLNRYACWENIRDHIRHGRVFGLLAIDLDHFRQINNHFGHSAGDEIVLGVAKSIRECLPANHILARHGNDDFLVIAAGETSAARIMQTAHQITRHLKRPIMHSGTPIFVDASFGIACFPEHGETLDELLRNVNTALQEAKTQGGNLVQIFDDGMQTTLRENVWLEHNLRDALEKKSFTLHYQPKIRMADGTLAGVEALLRWTHPERGPINPASFIRSAENSGAIIELGRWVIGEAARQAALWHKLGFKHRIALNISVMQLRDPQLIPLLKLAQETAWGLLDIEITESTLMDEESKVLNFIDECRQLGYGLHLDDFGTGYSSLSQMGRLPLDVVKLDRAFINGNQAERNRTLVRSLVAAATELGFNVVAEGVETQEQAAFLTSIGVTFAQGWLYSAARPAEEIEALYMSRQARPQLRVVPAFL